MKNLILAFICLSLVIPCQARTIFVDANTPDNNDGSSWAKAYKYLQDALADANSAGDVNEIWVAQGIYTPDSNSADPNGSGDREATFQLINGVTIKGGYAGFGQPDPNARDIELYETILSGDLDDNDGPNFANNGENSYHVVTGSGTDANAVLDGFAITAGNANNPSYPDYLGGGMYNTYSSPTLTNCTFSENSARASGGGMSNRYNSSPTLTNCTFSKNSAIASGGGMYNSESSPMLTNCTFMGNLSRYGGGMYNDDYSSPTLTNCTFSGNQSWRAFGGGMVNRDFSSPTLTNCTFSENSAAETGGGMYNYQSNGVTVTNCTFINNCGDRAGGGIQNSGCSPLLTHCTFTGNRVRVIQLTGGGGGGICNSGGSPVLTSCIFAGNHASWGGAVSNQGSTPKIINCTFSSNYGCGNAVVNWSDDCNPAMTNCILWDGGNEILNKLGATINITYSNIQDGWFGQGNIDVDPCFAAPGYWDTNGTPEDSNDDFWVDGDYHLKSEGWRLDAQRKAWTWDDVTSRCIDAGNPGSPLGEELLSVPDDPNNIWGQNLRINMGAYGGTAEASIPPYDWALPADLTNDGLVNLKDYAFQATDWLNSADQQPGDLNRDSLIYISDLALLAEDWLKQTTWHE